LYKKSLKTAFDSVVIADADVIAELILWAVACVRHRVAAIRMW